MLHADKQPKPDLAVFVAELAHGGVGKMRVHLINEFARCGHRVDLLLARTDSPYLDKVNPAVRVVKTGTSHALFGIPHLAWYLATEKPRIMLTQRVRVNVLALRAKKLVRSNTEIFVTANTNITRQLESATPQKRAKQYALLRRYYPRNSGIIAVSRGVGDDLAQILGWPPERIKTAPNPVITPELYKLAEEPAEHPWFSDNGPPVILGMGRLEPQKDFPTLLRAFALLHQQRPCRLMILGEGALRAELTALAQQLGITDDLQLPGFATNPYPSIARADLFVLSSLWEGSPNGLTEALALGTPLVATDCPNGPDEILEQGKYGPLVPMGNAAALAEAMRDTLESPPDRSVLRAAAQRRYTVEQSASAYLEAMGLA